MVISECHVNWDSNILLFWEVCALLSRRARLNTHLYETERIAAAFIIQGCDPWKKKERGLNIWNMLQIILNNILLYSLLIALAVQRCRRCLCMWVTQFANLGALWSACVIHQEKRTARLPQGPHSIFLLPVHYKKQLVWQTGVKSSKNHKGCL